MAGNVKTVTIDIDVKTGKITKGRKEFDRLNSTVNKGSKEMKGSMSSLNKSIVGIGASMAGAFAIKAVIGDAVKRIMEFEKSISSLSALTGAVGKDLGKLKGIVLQTAKDTKKSASEIAKAFELVASARPDLLKNADALAAVTKSAITLAKASGLDLTTAVNATTTGLAQFNLKASQSEEVIDALAAGAKYGASAIPETTAAIEKFGAVADSSNISIQDSVALIETLATKQLKGSEAGTQMKNVILKLKNAGLGFVDGQFNMNAALEEAKTKFENITDPVKRSQEQTKLFGLESSVAGEILLNNIGTFENFQTKVGETGVALAQAEIQTDNLSTKVEELDNQYGNLLVSLEDGTGVLSQFSKGTVSYLSSILGGLESLNEFDWDSLFSPDSAHDFTTSLVDLTSALTGLRFETVGIEITAIDNHLKKLTTSQLENGLVVKKLVDEYGKHGISQDAARIKIREELAAREANTEAIEEESAVLEENTGEEIINTAAKKKAISTLEAQLAIQKKFREELEKNKGILDQPEDISDEEEEEEADNAMFAYAEKEQKKTDIKEEERQKDKENADAMKEIISEEQMAQTEEDDIARQKKIDDDQLEHEMKLQRNLEIGMAAADLAGALSQLAEKGSQEAKALAIVQVIINGAMAVVQALAQLGPIAGALAAGAIAITVGLQINKINNAKALKDGEIMIDGDGTETSDSIPAMLSKNESVINAKSSKKHTAALKAINDDRFDDYLNRVIMQQLYTGKTKDRPIVINQKKEIQKFPDSFRVNNAKEIAKGVSEALENHYQNQSHGWV